MCRSPRSERDRALPGDRRAVRAGGAVGRRGWADGRDGAGVAVATPARSATSTLDRERHVRTIRVAVEGAELEVISEGAGEPVILVQTALLAEEFAAVAREPVLAEHFRVIRYHRRGYSGSTDVAGPGSIVRDAADCRGVAAALSVDRAHVVGLSFSCAIALTLAARTRCVGWRPCELPSPEATARSLGAWPGSCQNAAMRWSP